MPRWFDLSSVVELVVTPIVGLVEPNAPRIRFEVTASTVGPKPGTPGPWVHTRSVVAASPGEAFEQKHAIDR
jgi:hypothetical protein